MQGKVTKFQSVSTPTAAYAAGVLGILGLMLIVGFGLLDIQNDNRKEIARLTEQNEELRRSLDSKPAISCPVPDPVN